MRATTARIHQFWRDHEALPHSTWASLRKASTYQAIRQLKASGSLDLGECIEQFYQDATAKKQEIRELEEHNQQLRAASRSWACTCA
ncbi:MAG: hypothetical protein Q4D19_12610 [Lautropia sp.]|nr:hypothetical protein [Lautropia sp.]